MPKASRHSATTASGRNYQNLGPSDRASPNLDTHKFTRLHGFPAFGKATTVIRAHANNDHVELLDTVTPPGAINVKSDIEWISQS